ncbi:MAG: EAL domain-containing protein [Lysobacteraceae bacterium]|nr:MAG: EAL domain-containing protein [Xanthomonadaceae bacterium]
MSKRRSDPVPPPAADKAETLDALDRARRDPRFDADTAALLDRAHDALRSAIADTESERLRYRALFDAVPDPVSIIDRDGTVLDLNKAGMTAYRRSREEVVGQTIEVLNPDLPKDHMGPVWEALDRGETYVVEVTNMRADGSRFPVEVHSAGFDYQGKKRIVAVARDLSRRWQAETRYRLLMESIDLGVILFDRKLEVVSSNPAAHRILNAPDGMSVRDFLRSIETDWKVVDETGKPLDTQHWPVTRALKAAHVIHNTLVGLYELSSRRMTWVSVTAVPVFQADGTRPEFVFAMFSDVTTLKRDNILFDRAQGLARIGGWEWDRGRRRLYLTHEAQRILGHDPPPDTMEELLHGLGSADRPRLGSALDRLFEAGGSFDLELQYARSDNQISWIRVIGEADVGDPSTARIVGTLQDITERKHAEETLRVQARTDPLTGLLNRDAILAELDQRLQHPGQTPVAVLYVDLDRFKVVNDVLGHAAGDELLAAASQRIAQSVGADGLVARFGGDEFLVVCGLADEPERPERIAAAILQSLSDSFRFDNEEFTITASIGIARAPEDGERPQSLIQNADAAMYDSKRRSRNAWQAFTPALAQTQADRLWMETHLRRAVDNGEFHLVYQPQVDLLRGRIVAAEALIRWQNHLLGELRPDRFISHAETTGDIVRIGGWVLREACRQVAAWRDAGLGIVRVAVNVSYRQFLGEDLAESVRRILDEFQIPGAALELEFTERVLIEDAPDTLRTFADLRAMDVMLTIDDFGEGYSALNYLRRLPIHGLKLSQLFVEGVPANHSDVAVCQAVAGIARSLNLGLVAEGVESEAQRQFLLRLGVPIGQGFLFAPGLKPDEFARRLQSGGVHGPHAK